MKNCRLVSLILAMIMLFQFLFVQKTMCIYAAEEIEFPEITREQLKTELKRTVANGHPYMIATKENVSKVKEFAFGKDETLTELYSYVKSEADKLLDTDIFTIDAEIASNSMNNTKAMLSYTHTMILGLVYLVENDERYAQRAYDQMEYLCKLDSWGTLQMIDNVQFAWAVGFCYDWLYDWLTPAQKEILVSGLRRLHLDVVSDLFRNPNKEEYKWSFHQAFFASNNHGLMDNSCTFLAAMAIADTDIDFAAELMEVTLKHFNVPVANFYPDGIWYEGPSYWGYAGPYTARLMQSMISAFGHCFGYDEIEFLKKLADYPIYTQSDIAVFNVGDCHFNYSYDSEPTFFMIGSLSDNTGLQSYAIRKAKEKKAAEPFTVLMYDIEKSYNAEIELSLDKLFRGSMYQTTMRSSRNGTQNTFVGMNVMRKFDMNEHADSGTLAFDALGERWITNNSKEQYYHGYAGTMQRFSWYRTRAEANSCIVINPSEHPGQDFFSDSVCIDRFESKSGGAFAIANLSKAYATQVESYSRGIQLADNRKAFVVQDEIILKNPSEIYSFFNIYDAEIDILDDGKTAILRKNNKTVYVIVDCDKDFTLDVMPAEPLSTSPTPDSATPNSSNNDFMKLYLHFNNVENVNIRVSFIPYLCEEELSSYTCTKFVPMADWVIEDEVKTVPMLEDIKICGTELDDFESYNRCYEVNDDISAFQVEPIYDRNKYNVTVLKDKDSKAIDILLVDKSDSSNMNSYSLSIPDVVYPETTYTNSSFEGIMMPQEFYRIASNDSLSVMYFKNTAPADCKRAVLTMYAGVIGENFDTRLKQCTLDNNIVLENLSGFNTPISKNIKAKVSLSSIGISVISGTNMQMMEYDITSMLPEDGGDYVFALLPVVDDEDYIVIPSHRNSDYSLRPRIKYYH